VAVEALGRCKMCSRYFLRLRGTRKVYCSPRCTWQAFRARQKTRPKRKRRPRRGAGAK
jgi:hypothetical protein